jgi:hypothetical protein
MNFLRFAFALALALTLALALAAPSFAAEGVPRASGVVVHEWGTFTSVAGKDGAPVEWIALSGPADLPCFVNHLGGMNFKAAMGMVRMETPVLYFYSPTRTSVSVHVDFPQGLITEWYPQAARVLPVTAPYKAGNGQIDWGPVEVAPGDPASLPSGKSASHYYAARETDAAQLGIGAQREKMLFYRGIGWPDVPLQARFTTDGKLELRNTGSQPIPVAIVFENHGGKIGYRTVHALGRPAKVDVPDLTAGLDGPWFDPNALRYDLATALVEAGLYEKEAQAMIATWSDSWFEEGTRVFYIVPRATVDGILPLRVTPAPKSIARVFVGRVEVLAPSSEKTLRTALAAGDIATLRKYGRFLDAYMHDMDRGKLAHAAVEFLDAGYRLMQNEFQHPSCSQ